MAWRWVVLLAFGVLLYSIPGLLQIRIYRGEHVPRLGWRIDSRRLPLWAWLPYIAGIMVIIFAAERLFESPTWRWAALMVGCYVVSWAFTAAVVRRHNLKVASDSAIQSRENK